MKLKIILLSMMVFSHAYADKVFVCTSNMGTGFKFNNARKNWQPTLFDVTGNKFLLKKQGKTWRYIRLGKKYQINCGEMGNDGSLFCHAYFGQTQFNEKTLRYVETYNMGYIDKQENNNNTPSVEIGECARLDT